MLILSGLLSLRENGILRPCLTHISAIPSFRMPLLLDPQGCSPWQNAKFTTNFRRPLVVIGAGALSRPFLWPLQPDSRCDRITIGACTMGGLHAAMI